MRKKVLLYLFIGCNIVLNATNNSKIKGTVKDIHGNILPGATVWVDELGKGTVADENGQFIIESLGAGTYSLECAFLGYEPVLTELKIQSEDVLSPEIILQDREVTMKEVVVNAGRRNPNKRLSYTLSRLPVDIKTQPQTISVIDRKLLDEQGVTDIKDAILNVLGAYSWATYGGAMNSFGSRGYRGISYMKDGVLMETSQPEMDGVEDVQVI